MHEKTDRCKLDLLQHRSRRISTIAGVGTKASGRYDSILTMQLRVTCSLPGEEGDVATVPYMKRYGVGVVRSKAVSPLARLHG